MTIEVQCPCGKTLNVRDDLAGRRVKCPVCAEILTVPSNGDAGAFFDEEDDEGRDDAPPQSRLTPRRGGREMSVSGKPANANLGAIVPASFGRTTLSLESDRVVEETRKPLVTRHTELRLKKVDSVEISTAPNPTLLVLGIVTIPVFGIGLLVLLVWIFVRVRFLAIRSGSNALVVCMQGPDDRYHDFMDAVLAACDGAGE